MNFQKIAKTAASNLNKKVLTSDWFLGTLKSDYSFKSEIAAYLVADLATDILQGIGEDINNGSREDDQHNNKLQRATATVFGTDYNVRVTANMTVCVFMSGGHSTNLIINRKLSARLHKHAVRRSCYDYRRKNANTCQILC